jgi:hypothetical protein
MNDVGFQHRFFVNAIKKLGEETDIGCTSNIFNTFETHNGYPGSSPLPDEHYYRNRRYTQMNADSLNTQLGRLLFGLALLILSKVRTAELLLLNT